jgi:hypothetical protein
VHDFKERRDLACVPAATSDGWRAYFYALTAHLGFWFRQKGARTEHWRPSKDLVIGQPSFRFAALMLRALGWNVPGDGITFG